MQDNGLLVNANTETQVKDKPIKNVSRVVIITLLSLFIFIGYFLSFSAAGYIKIATSGYIGVLNTKNHYSARFGDLCVVRELENYNTIKTRDIIFYTINGEMYSAPVESVSDKIIVVKKGEELHNVPKTNIDGKLVKTVGVIGFFVGIISSVYSAIACSIILFIYLAVITISRINYENTEKGKNLRQKYFEEKKLLKRTRQQEQKIKTDNTSLLESIEGDVLTTLNNIKKIADNNKVFETYELLLEDAHEYYFSVKRLSKEDRRKITILVELSVCFNRVNLDVEYMLVDLIILAKLEGFNKQQFLENSKKLITKGTEESLFNFISILYVLISRNENLKVKEIKNILQTYKKEITTRNYDDNSRCKQIYLKTMELFK